MSRQSHPRPLQVAIDGFVATGKSTVGATVAQRLGILYLDTGVMYRVVALLALEDNIDLSSAEACARLAETMDLRLYHTATADGWSHMVCVGDRDVTKAIRSDAVNHAVPLVSTHQRVRNILIHRQQHIANHQPVVMVGRDIASVVLPNAQLKVRLTATLEVRVRRRANELLQDRPHTSLDLDRLREQIQRRDELDDIHLSRVSDVIVVNTEFLSVNEVVDTIVRLIPVDSSLRHQTP